MNMVLPATQRTSPHPLVSRTGILYRIEFSPLSAILAFIPFVNLLGFWVLTLPDLPEGKA
jgi:hypothetical protein